MEKNTDVSAWLRAMPVAAAPMAGYTDRAFREILRDMGAGLIYTEMVSDMALCYGSQKTFAMLDIAGERGPLVIQLCGSEPEYMARGARIIEDWVERQQAQVVMLDINMGCPAPKIVKNGEGCRLMQRPEQAARVVAAVAGAVRLPVSVKLRLGWDQEHQNVLEVARLAAAAGARLVAIHGRTREQFYAGEADWHLIGEAAARLSVPVLGNGDIDSVAGAKERLAETGCAGVMIGRGLLGNPWLMRDLAREFGGLAPLGRPGPGEILAVALRHLWRQVEICGEYMGVRQMRSHLPLYIKGIPGAAAMRGRLNGLSTLTEVENALVEFLSEVR